MFKENKNQVNCTLWLLLYKRVRVRVTLVFLPNLLHCNTPYILYDIMGNNKLNSTQNSQQNNKKEIVELNFGINYTLQQTIAMLKMLNVVFNVSLNSQSTHEPNHFISPLKTSNEAVNLSTTTELNHRNSTVCERVINSQQRSFLHERAH